MAGCHTRTQEEKDERFPGAKAEVTWPFYCLMEPTFQELARALQESQLYWKGATIVGGKIMAFTSCTVIDSVVCLNV